MNPIINIPSLNQMPFIRTSRQWPTDQDKLNVELNTSYNEVAQAINLRSIGLFSTNRSVVTGDSWYLNSTSRQQSIRQLFTLQGPIVGATTLIPHYITPGSYTNFVRIWGTFQDQSGIWDTLPYVAVSNITNQIKLQVDSTNIIITQGSSAPAINNLVVVIEYLANV